MVRTLAGKHPQYFEAILQLRDISQDVINVVEEEISRVQMPVAKEVKLKNGSDYYLADKDFTKALGKRLQQQFGGELLVTASLFGRKDGKEIYRVTVLFRQAPFKKGDVVEYQGEEYEVKLVGKGIFLQNKKTGKRAHVKYKDMKEIKKGNVVE